MNDQGIPPKTEQWLRGGCQAELVSIIVPTKNRLPLLTEAMHSIRDQTCPNWELIIVDDGSSDSTRDCVRVWTLEDRRIRLVCRSNAPSGANHCRNLGVSASSGEYVMFLDSDDRLASTCVENRLAYMHAHPDLDFAVFGCRLFHTVPGDTPLYYNCHTGENDLARFLQWDNPWGTTCPIWQRATLHSLLWDEALPSLQDWDFHLRAVIKGLRYEKVPDADWFYRVPADHRPSTSRKLFSREHMPAHERLLDKLHGLLRERDLLRSETALPLAGVHFCLAVSCAAKGQIEAAMLFWRSCRDRGLISSCQHEEGKLYLRVFPRPLARRAVNLYLAIRWPSSLRQKRSATRFKTRSLTAPLI